MRPAQRWRGCAQTLLILLVAVPSSSFSPRLFTASPAALLGEAQAQFCKLRPPRVVARLDRVLAGCALARCTNLRATSGATEAVVGTDEEGDQAAAADAALLAFREFYTAQGICPGGDAEVPPGPPAPCHFFSWFQKLKQSSQQRFVFKQTLGASYKAGTSDCSQMRGLVILPFHQQLPAAYSGV